MLKYLKTLNLHFRGSKKYTVDTLPLQLSIGNTKARCPKLI